MFAIDKIQKHLFVIAAQTPDAFRIVTTEFGNVLDAARHVRPAIDEVAEKDERVRCFITRQQIEQPVQLRTTAVNVTNDECFHSERREALAMRARISNPSAGADRFLNV